MRCRPFRACANRAVIPRAHALGCPISPLRGSPLSESRIVVIQLGEQSAQASQIAEALKDLQNSLLSFNLCHR